MTIKCERCGKVKTFFTEDDARIIADYDCWDTVCGRFYCAACAAKLEDDYGLVMNGWYDVRRKLVEMVRGDSK